VVGCPGNMGFVRGSWFVVRGSLPNASEAVPSDSQ
jgi:hypothetical protein